MSRYCEPVERIVHGFAFLPDVVPLAPLWPQKLTLGHATVDNMFRDATRRTNIEIQEMVLGQLEIGMENKDTKGQAVDRKDEHKKQLTPVGLAKEDVNIDAGDDEALDADEEAHDGLDELAEHRGFLVLVCAVVVYMQGSIH